MDEPDYAETARIGEALRSWVPERADVDHNVVVVGGGQNGAAFAFALGRAGIGNVSVIDAAEDESKAGVWLTRARMRRLRTPKSVPGPELGVQELSFRCWYEAQHGSDAYDVFDRISRTDWADYLRWYRTTLGIAVRYRTRLISIEPQGELLKLHLEVAGRPVVETTRKLILANGVAGSGGANIPALLKPLPRSHTAHTSDDIDFGSLAGKRVAIVGAAASAFDAAAVALEAGAEAVHMFVRRHSISSIPIYRNRFYAGAFEHYASLPDAIRWRQAQLGYNSGSTPPAESIDRVTRFKNFHLHLGSPWASADLKGNKVVAVSRGERFEFDFVIAGTGYTTDLSLRPELAPILGDVLLWRDRYQPPAGEENDEIGLHPYLGLAHELLERQPGTAPHLGNIHIYNPGAYVSFGLPTGDLWTLRRDVPIITKRIGLDLFLGDVEHHGARMSGPVPPEFGIERYAASIWHSTVTADVARRAKPSRAALRLATENEPSPAAIAGADQRAVK